MLDIADHVAETFLQDAPVVPVSVTTGEGLDDLRAALDDLVATTPQAVDRSRPRLWIDRVFAAKGSGTVVTGTLTGGSLTRDHAVVIEPGGRPARVRSIQSLRLGDRPHRSRQPRRAEPRRDRPRRGRPGRRGRVAGPVVADPTLRRHARGARAARSRRLPPRCLSGLHRLTRGAREGARDRIGRAVAGHARDRPAPPAGRPAAAARRSVRAARVGPRRDRRWWRGARRGAGTTGVEGRSGSHRRAGDPRARVDRRSRARAADRHPSRTDGGSLGRRRRDARRDDGSAPHEHRHGRLGRSRRGRPSTSDSGRCSTRSTAS